MLRARTRFSVCLLSRPWHYRPLQSLARLPHDPLADSQEVLLQGSSTPFTLPSALKEKKKKKAVRPTAAAKSLERVLEFIRPVLLSTNVKKVEDRTYATIRNAEYPISHRGGVYDGVIRFLISEMWAQPAAAIFKDMEMAGFTPGQDLAAQLMAVSLVDVNEDPTPVLNQLRSLVSRRDYEEDALVNLLAVARDYALPIEYTLECVRCFSEARGPTYQPRADVIIRVIQNLGRSGSLALLSDTVGWEVEPEVLEIVPQTEPLGVGTSQKLLLHLIRSVGNPRSSDEAVIHIFAALERAEVDFDVIAQAAESYVANRDANCVPRPALLKRLVSTFIRADDLNRTFELLERAKSPKDATVHHAFLSAFRDNLPQDGQSFRKILSSVLEAGLPVDTSIFNMLIAREVRLGQTARALAIYSELKDQGLTPDTYTFSTLFAMYRQIKPVYLKRYGTKDTQTGQVSAIRQLFREMVCASQQEHGPVLSTTSLNIALRTFVRQKDYAAAIIVIHTFGRRDIALDHRTYYSVVKLIVRRVWKEVRATRKSSQTTWAHRFLGVPSSDIVSLSPDLVLQIRNKVRMKEFDVAAPLYTPMALKGRKRPLHPCAYHYPFPTKSMMESVQVPEPKDFVYHPLPLQRLLAKALLAEEARELGTEHEWVNEQLELAARAMLDIPSTA